jgi:hypothetical protein
LDEIEVRTNEISAAYLSWAARGQGIEAAHDVLAGRPGALDRLSTIGATSGAAIAYGIGLGLRHLPTPGRHATRPRRPPHRLQASHAPARP